MTEHTRTLPVPDLSLVVLIGASGSGKSTFARKHFKATEVLSSDTCRGLVSDDENDQTSTSDAFDVLHYIAGKRLAAGRITVVDATNVQPEARRQLVELAREHDVLPVAIVLDMPESVCRERNEARADRDFPHHVITRHRRDLKRSLRGLQKEGFRKVHVLTTVAEVENAEVTVEKRYNDLTHLTGPFDIIGDIHGCASELRTLLTKLGYTITGDDAVHPEGRTAVFVGDLVDRGPDSPGVLRLVMGMVGAGHALCVPGNHENKLLRHLNGRNVKLTYGLQETVDQLAVESEEFIKKVRDFCEKLVSHYVLDDGKLVVAHAGLIEKYHGRTSGRVRSFAMYGDTTGETDEYGLPVRYPWADEYRGRAMVVYGHTPTTQATFINNTICLDTGCVFGGELTALRYPEKELVAVEAERVWYEPTKPLAAQSPGARDGRTLDIADVLDISTAPGVIGRRHVQTGHGSTVTIRGEYAAAALEVMSRFAVDPRWLMHLPPTMSPCATAKKDGFLEYPTEAFSYYQDEGVTKVVCEEKHMGSRANVLVCRDAAVAAERFGVEDGTTGVVVTRTGRPFFNTPDLTEGLLARIRTAADKSGLWETLDTDWMLLDAELMPWSAKAVDLLKNQYAAVGAAARTVLPTAVDALSAATARGVDVGALLSRTEARTVNSQGFDEAYGRYCWPVDGLDGVKLAPFQILAVQGRNLAVRPHDEHLAWIDALIAQDTETFTATRRLTVDLTDAKQVEEACAWWEEMTGAGGEGMVVKPLASYVKGAKFLVQPGIKVRGREYLRIIYGPDYTSPENLERLRERGLNHKRSLAQREYALGLESLDRLAAGEPLWRVHEAVFGVLALESEPVDPRL